MSLPSQSEIENSRKNPNQSTPYPQYSQPPNPNFYEKPNRPGEINNNNPPPPNYGAPAPGNPQMQRNPMPMNRPMPVNGPRPIAQPVYVPPPMAVPGAVPYYPPPYPGVYPYPYPMPPYGYPRPINSVVVLPPGYHRDFSAGYSPWGDLADDLDNLF